MEIAQPWACYEYKLLYIACVLETSYVYFMTYKHNNFLFKKTFIYEKHDKVRKNGEW